MVSQCGCYYEAGPGAQTVTKYLPQVDVVAHTTILATASATELTQTFINPSKTEDIPECRYVFPLYDGVSVTAFACEIGSRVLQGVVKENTEAKEVYNEAVSRGEIAGILEQGPTTDVFTTTLGNIRAGEKLQVRIRYIGELKYDLALEGIRFTLPTFISPRYGPSGPQGDMDSASAGAIAITVDVNMPKECPIQEIRSPSHLIALSLGRTSVEDDISDLSKASATLSLGTSALDKDFVLEVRNKDSGKARALLESHPKISGQRALMTTLVPQICKSQAQQPEIIIVADQSGSMRGGRSKTLVAALRILLKSLPVGINFNICAFGTGNTFLWERSHVYNEKSLAEAMKFIEMFDGHLGGTETLSAVQAALESRDPGERLSMILATDGDIWQQGDLFSYLDRQIATTKKAIRVFPLGIGDSVSSGLIEGVARAGNGFASSVGEGEKLDSKVIRMLKGALTPDSDAYTMEVQYHRDNDEEEYELVDRVTDSLRIIMVDESDSSGALAASAMVIDEEKTSARDANITAPKLLQAPQILPSLFPLTRTTVYILLSPDTTRGTPKTVILRSDAPENRFEISIPVEVLTEPGTTIHSLAAKRAILELEEGRGWLSHAKDASGQFVKDSLPAKKYDDLVKQEAVRLGVQYQITGKYTSSVAVEHDSASENGKGSTERDISIARPPDSSEVADQIMLFDASSYARSSSPGSRSRSALMSSVALPKRKQNVSILACKAVPAASKSPLSAFSGAVRGVFQKKGRGGGGGGGRGGAFFPSAAEGYATPCSSIPQTAAMPCPPPSGLASHAYGNAGPTSFGAVAFGGTSAVKENGFDCISNEPRGLGVEKDAISDEGTVDGPDPVQRLIGLQTFAGFWEFSKKLLKACAVKPDHSAPKDVDTKVWATILAVTFLELKMGQEKVAWEMVVEKANSWLEGRGVDGHGEGKALREAAERLIGGN